MSLSNKIKSYPLWVYALPIACLFILLRPFKIMGIGLDGDATRVWYHIRQLSAGVEITDVTHHTVRFGILFPTRIIEFLFGNSYYVSVITPILFSLLIIFLLYYFTSKYIDKFYSFCFVLAFSSLPSFLHGSTTLFPSIFSSLYVMCTFLMLYKYFEEDKTRYIILSALFMFFAYGTKVPNIIWAFGIIMGLLLTGRVRGFFIFSSCLLILYATEHILLYHLFNEPLGRLGVIVKKHIPSSLLLSEKAFGQDLNNVSFFQKIWTIIDYKLLSMKIKYLVLVIPTIISASWGLIVGDRFIKVLSVSLLFFYIFTIFGIKSYEPLITLQPNKPRYIFCSLPIALVIFSYIFKHITSQTKFTTDKPYIKFLFLFLTVAFYITFFHATPSSKYMEDLNYQRKLNNIIPNELRQGSNLIFLEQKWGIKVQAIEGLDNKHYWWAASLFFPDDILFSEKIIIKEFHDYELNKKIEYIVRYDDAPNNGKYLLIIPKPSTRKIIYIENTL